MFTDVINKYVFITRDYGSEFFANDVPCKPDIVSLHPLNPDIILIMEKDDKEKRVGFLIPISDLLLLPIL